MSDDKNGDEKRKYQPQYPVITPREMLQYIDDAIVYNTGRKEDRFALHFQGHPGIGKTMVIASKYKPAVVVLSIGDVNEMGDILGFPKADEISVNGYKKHIMIWAPPEFTEDFEKHDHGVLILDD